MSQDPMLTGTHTKKSHRMPGYHMLLDFACRQLACHPQRKFGEARPNGNSDEKLQQQNEPRSGESGFELPSSPGLDMVQNSFP